MSDIQIAAEMTPNPNTLKFNVDRTIVESGAYDFPNLEASKNSYLAGELFQIAGVTGVYVASNFITVTKTVDTAWQSLVPPVIEKIKAVLNSGEKLVSETAVASTNNTAGDGAIEMKIREILDNEIRPAVARDGGDIVFYGYKEGVVTLHLQGACSSCPSSIMTLKMGVENRLKQSIPEIRDVVQV